MIGSLTDKLQNIFSKVASKKLTEGNISEAVREVRLALLDADVNYSVVKTFIKRVKEKALGEQVLKSVSPGQQFIKTVHDELVALMGENESDLKVSGSLSVLMVCGLQGSGKTTFCAKLAKWIQKKPYNRKPLLVACDLQRPAAIEQLKVLAAQIGVDVFSIEGETNPKKVAKLALKEGYRGGYNTLIIDTAGRLHIDKELMSQLQDLKQITNPDEVLFVANAQTGQDAVNVAAEFNSAVEVTGTVLTMLDGNTRGGAAISIREVTGKPLKFEGIGEKLDDIQIFSPKSMADRILGMGDTINLVKKAQEHISEKEAQEFEKKIRKASFTYADYLKQMQMVKKMGSLKGLLKMLPGASALKDVDISDKDLKRVEAIILSMTPKERQEETELVMSRRRRIARGSGTSLDEVNKLIKTFKRTKQLFKQMSNKKSMLKLMGGM